MGAAPRPPAGRSHAHRVRSICGVAALLAPRDRNRTLTALAEAEPATAPHDGGALFPDDSGDRESGHATASVSRQYLGSRGQVGNGIVAATTARADEPVYFPPHTVPYRPAPVLPQGPADPAFRTKGQLAADLVARARAKGIAFRALVADCFHGPGESPQFIAELDRAATPNVAAVEPNSPLMTETGETRTPSQTIVASSDPLTLPPVSVWYLVTDLPCRARKNCPLPPADMAGTVGLYGLRGWTEQDDKHVKHELGRADFQVRSGQAIQRHWTPVDVAFGFCWHQSPQQRAPSRVRPTLQRP
ncbi:transposase [Streptomyces inhibens]|uniref:transposase n=1 Tax=Streptomyces inhibens TaxID=2293571 RepID=UPI00402A6780